VRNNHSSKKEITTPVKGNNHCSKREISPPIAETTSAV
jgi:hypothetical protein